LIKLLHFYRRFEPDARLILVGGLLMKDYVRWLQRFAKNLGLTDSVTFTGHVTQQEMVTYYKTADLFVSMSEHEGFGKPLIESMYLDLPVLAYASTAVPLTLGGAGVLFNDKDFEGLAEMADMLIKDQRLRSQVQKAQRERVKTFLEPNVRKLWATYLEALNLL
jgi:glycosyltransferase involved in cell wall biosynthesis